MTELQRFAESEPADAPVPGAVASADAGAAMEHLRQRVEAMVQGDFSALGQPISGPPAFDALRQVIDTLGAQSEQARISMQRSIAALTTAQETERERVARELHDDSVQRLIALGQRVERTQRALATSPQHVADQLKLVRADVLATIESLRAAIADLRPPVLEELGLGAALEMLLQRTGARCGAHGQGGTPVSSGGGMQITIEMEGRERRLEPKREIAVFRMLQEAWSNVQQHAHASQARFHLTYGPDALVVIVVDDGQGFPVPPDPAAPDRVAYPHATEDTAVGRGYGLRIMQERAALIGGSVTVDSTCGQGTRLHFLIPYTDEVSISRTHCPVCGADLDSDLCAPTVIHAGAHHRFCTVVCRELYLARPIDQPTILHSWRLSPHQIKTLRLNSEPLPETS